MSRQGKPAGPAHAQSGAETEADGSDLLWGINAVMEALSPTEVLLSEVLVERGKAGPRLQEIIDLAKTRGVPVKFVDAARMRVPRNCRHQGVVARQSAARLLDFSEFVAHLRGSCGVNMRVLALDCIQDPRNLGSILRSALAAGFSHVLMTRERSVPLTGTVARTSAGAIVHLQLCQVVNLSEALKALKELGCWVYGAVVESEAASIYTTDFAGSVCLVIGGEGKGLRPLVRKQCDVLVTIPMRNSFNSLNASVAAAVIMFAIDRSAP